MPKNILFVLKNFSRSGGVEKVSLNLASQFKREGHKVSFFIMDGQAIPDEVNNEFDIYSGTNGGLKGIVKLLPALVNWIKKGKYSAVIAAKEQANIITFLASLLYGGFTPIYTRHSAFDVSEQELSVNTLHRLYSLYGKGRGKIVAVSSDLAEYIRVNIPKVSKKVHCCPNPIVSESIFEKAVKNSDNFQYSRPYMCAVGRLCQPKGFDLLLTIYKLALASTPNIPDLVIVGEGPDFDKLHQQRNDLELNDRVHFSGYTTNPYYIINNSELFLLSSRNEGLPTVLIEALALRKNVVAFDCPTGPDEVLQQGKYGTLISVGDIESFAKSINQLLSKPLEIPAHAIEQYTFEKSSNAYLALVNN